MSKSSLIGRIAFDLVANTGKLLAPLKQARAALAGFSKQVGAMAAVAAGAATAAAGYAVYKMIGGIKQAYQELGDLSDESARLGIPAEQLSALQYAAKQSGVEVGMLGKSLQFLMKKGISVEKLGKIADELDRVTDPVKKMQLALKYFGKGGAGMINMLSGGSKKLNEMIEKAKRLGIVFTQEQVDAIEKSGDAIADVHEALRGIYGQLAIRIEPYVTFIAEKLTEWGTNINASSGSIGWVETTMATILDTAAAIGLGIDYWKVAYLGWISTVTQNPVDLVAWEEANDAYFKKLMGESPSEEIRRKAREAAGLPPDAKKGPAGGMRGGVGSASMEALMRGSQAAMSAILATSKKTTADEMLAETKKMRAGIDDLVAAGIPLLGTDLG